MIQFTTQLRNQLMRLRHIIAHVRHQNWTAVAIDFVIVVMGVFIGIQVSNWNAGRNDKVRAVGYLERIRDDLRADIDIYAQRVEFWIQVSDYGKTGLAFASGSGAGEQSDWKVLLAFFHASQVGQFNVTDATYEELKSAGELGLVGDPGLRDRLAYYYVNAGNPAIMDEPAYREHVRQIIPIDVQLYIWEQCYLSEGKFGQKLLDCPPPAEPERVSQILRRITGDEKLIGELTFWVSSMHVAGIIAKMQIALAVALENDVSAMLGH